MIDSIAILDFGSQYAQLIARKLREESIYCELFAWNTPSKLVMGIQPSGFILSGGPASVYEPGAPKLPAYILESRLPILGICYGMQALTHALGGVVKASSTREYGKAELVIHTKNPLLDESKQIVWMSHGDRIEQMPPNFHSYAQSIHSPVAFMGDIDRGYYGLQFHPEVHHTPGGKGLLRRYATQVCGIKPEWNASSIITSTIERVRNQVGNEPVISAVSGGVDSSVATALVQQAIGEQLAAVFVDTGLLRQNEAEQVRSILQEKIGVDLICVDAQAQFLDALRGITAPEEKRRIIGELFIRVFEAQAKKLGAPRFLVQGTIYPDVVESSAPDRAQAQRIKTHHNVGGLPGDMSFELVEPLRYLFKDEVRLVGETLGLPKEMVWRQPFPGPGLAVRCLGEVTLDRLDRLRSADSILNQELINAGFLSVGTEGGQMTGTSQAFTVLLPIKSVGVMGDQRTYQETVVLRAVTTEDFMTADWARLPYDFLERVSSRIVNEVQGVNRVVYDITSKPPATIEWE